MSSIRIGVGELVSFLFSAGDLTAETFMNVSLLEGTRAHQKHQSLYGENDHAEVPISHRFKTDEYDIVLSGRIDGLLDTPEGPLLEEIKTTRKAIHDKAFAPRRDHEAQLSLYAYMFMKTHDLGSIRGTITYIQLADEQKRSFPQTFLLSELESFFTDAIIDYLEWVKILQAQFNLKMTTIADMTFPFPSYRRGQREMMAAVYQAIKDNDIRYAIAPTGIGKTMAALFASLKGLITDTQKIFYLTAKTAGKQIALDALGLLEDKGLRIKALELTSRDTICFLEKRQCDPEVCPYAKGFFNRLKDATLDIITEETIMDRKTVEAYAKRHTVCPFEFSLHVSYFTDVVICDYNYVFDPRAHLIRYFDEDGYEPFILVDEAHNLVSRSRDMFTATLTKSSVTRARRLSSKLKPTVRTHVKRVLERFDAYDDMLSDQPFMELEALPEDFIEHVHSLVKRLETVLRENVSVPGRTELVDTYFELLGFVRMSERYADNYTTNILHKDGETSITLQCLDASPYLLETLSRKTYGSVLFSATLHPIAYYRDVLTRGKGETLSIRSPFDPENLEIIIMHKVPTRYRKRKESIPDVVRAILTTIRAKEGRYIAFFPSYGYMENVRDILQTEAPEASVVVQRRDMGHLDREILLDHFKEPGGGALLGLFVMGGMFAEGIDYIGDMLSGVIIVGPGLPMVSETNNQLRDYHDRLSSNGFDYAYLYPGMNKVIQAVGRVIRTPEDRGVAVLIDDRFDESRVKALYPPSWTNIKKAATPARLKTLLDAFWAKH